MPVEVAAFSPPGSCRPIVMPGSTVVDPKIVRDVGTSVSISCDSRAPTFVFSTSTVGDEPLTVTVSCSDASFIATSTVIVCRTGTTISLRMSGAKPASSNFRRVGPGVDGGEAIASLLVGDGGRRAHRRRARQRDGDAGQHAALVVRDLPYQLAEHLAGLCRRRCETERKHNRQSRERAKNRSCQCDLLKTNRLEIYPGRICWFVAVLTTKIRPAALFLSIDTTIWIAIVAGVLSLG